MSTGDRGSASIEFVWLSILLLVPVVYLLIAVFEVQSAAYGTSAASRSAARAFLQAPDPATGERRALAAVRLALRDQGAEPTSVRIECTPTSRDCLRPGSSVRVRVEVRQPLPLTPSLLGDDLGSLTVDSTHTESYGTYRESR